jgi:gamma-glutamyltranspeptidase/glutathione hydrolase
MKNSYLHKTKLPKTIPATFLMLAVTLVSLLVSSNLVAQTEPIYAGMDTVQAVWAEHGMVASQEAVATDVGVEILRKGGNAVDAAVAVGFALAVTYPRAGNIGGGGFMMIYLAGSEEVIAMDYREMAPDKAHKDMFLDENGDVVQEKTLFHGLSSGVPGSVMGMATALKEYGTMPLSEVIQPAIRLAEEGIVVSRDLSRSLSGLSERLQKWPSTTAIFYHEDGTELQVGEVLKQPDLAKTLKRIAKHGTDGFYKGKTAKDIATAVQQAGGFMTEEDLANYKTVKRVALQGNYRGYDVYSMPPPSSGGVHLVQILNILENVDITSMGHNSAASIHYMSEAMRQAYADRSEYLGDPDFYSVPVQGLTSEAYALTQFNQIDPAKATRSDEVKPGNPIPYESDQTTHYSVADQWGNAVSTTTTLNFSYGSGLVAAGTGVFMNNEMDDFSAKAGVPNAFGLLGGEANAVEAHKRPLSAMTPTIVLKDGKPFLVTGSPGGSRIITTTLQVIMNVIDHQMNVAEATYAGRIHHQWYPDEIRVERNLNVDTVRILEAMGHNISLQSAMGSTQSIMLTPEGFFGASDPRSRAAKTAGY